MKRLQIYIPEDLDAALAAESARTDRSKADLIREYVSARLPVTGTATDPLSDLVGMFDGDPSDSVSVDEVVYGR